jgi:hypothetical protein
VDLRVFQIKLNQIKFKVTVTANAAADVATIFIQKVLTNFNGNPGFTNAVFDNLLQIKDASSLVLAPTDTSDIFIYNFSLTRVRYRDIISANNVCVFFRI